MGVPVAANWRRDQRRVRARARLSLQKRTQNPRPDPGLNTPDPEV